MYIVHPQPQCNEKYSLSNFSTVSSVSHLTRKTKTKRRTVLELFRLLNNFETL